MSLPEFKFTNITKPTNDTTVNSGLSAKAKMVKSGIVPDIVDKAKLTAASLKTRVSDLSSSASSAWSGLKSRVSDIDLNVDNGIGDDDDDDNGDGGSSSFFSFTFLIKVILIVVILWFMWANLSNNGDFHLGMGDIGEKITAFFKKMEESGRELIAKITHASAPASNAPASASASTSDSDSDSDSDNENDKKPKKSTSVHKAPVPPPMNNSSDKKPGFNNEDAKYTFLDKASREYSGPSPRPDDSTSSTQKHQSGKAGYCYIGEDRGFRSCARVEAGDKCMSGEVFSRQDICIDPTLRE
jgi:hypothetical protein